MKPRISALLLTLIALGGCKKEIDPAYLKTVEEQAETVCGCVGDPNAFDCTMKGPRDPKAPGDEPPGIYEQGLRDEDVSRLEGARAKSAGCWAIIKKLGASRRRDDRGEAL